MTGTATTMLSSKPALTLRPYTFSLNPATAMPVPFCSSATMISCRRCSHANTIVSRETQGRKSSVPSTSACSCSVVDVNDTLTQEENDVVQDKIGARIRVKAPLKVFHVPKVPELDLSGMEGQLKQYVALWKGKRISANLPYKVEFIAEVEGRGPVKFFAHLKDGEFEYI